METYKNILTVLKLEHYANLISFMAYDNRKRIAIDILKNTIENGTILPGAEQVNSLLELVQPLVKDEKDQPEQLDQVKHRI